LITDFLIDFVTALLTGLFDLLPVWDLGLDDAVFGGDLTWSVPGASPTGHSPIKGMFVILGQLNVVFPIAEYMQLFSLSLIAVGLLWAGRFTRFLVGLVRGM